MTRVAIALGSNLGDRLQNLRRALDELRGAIKILGRSRVYETEPMYVADQPSFLNAAILAETDRGPLQLLKLLKDTETRVGRQPRLQNGPREIDLDLISFGQLVYRFSDKLVVPHPRVAERGFVLRPLLDLDPSLTLPGLGSVAKLLSQTTDGVTSVVEWGNAELPV